MEQFRGTTIVSVRRNGKVAIAGDGQVSMGNTVMKGNARKVRQLAGGRVIAGFAGGTADAFTLFELFESKLEQYGNLTRAAIELAKDWRTDRRLRRLEALLCVADEEKSFVVTGNGDVICPKTTSWRSVPAAPSPRPRHLRSWTTQTSRHATSSRRRSA